MLGTSPFLGTPGDCEKEPCAQGQSGAALHVLGTPLFLTLGFLEYIQSETPVKQPPKKAAISISQRLPMECPHFFLFHRLRGKICWLPCGLATSMDRQKDKCLLPTRIFACPPGPGGTGQLMWVSLETSPPVEPALKPKLTCQVPREAMT